MIVYSLVTREFFRRCTVEQKAIINNATVHFVQQESLQLTRKVTERELNP